MEQKQGPPLSYVPSDALLSKESFQKWEDKMEVEGDWISHDGVRMYTRTWKAPIQPPKAVIVAVHGFGEHIDRYDHVFNIFARQYNFQVHGWDQRGFGRTGRQQGPLGHTGGWVNVMKDVSAAIHRSRIDGVPTYLFGHSMGGMIVLSYATFHDLEGLIDGVISSAPAIRVAPECRPWKITLGLLSLLAPVIPTFPARSTIKLSDLCADKLVKWAYENSHYNLDFGSLCCLRDMFHNGEVLLERKSIQSFQKPLLLVHSKMDHVTDHEASQEFFSSLVTHCPTVERTLVLEEALGHEMHNEKCWNRIVDLYAHWINERLENHAAP